MFKRLLIALSAAATLALFGGVAHAATPAEECRLPLGNGQFAPCPPEVTSTGPGGSSGGGGGAAWQPEQPEVKTSPKWEMPKKEKPEAEEPTGPTEPTEPTEPGDGEGEGDDDGGDTPTS